MNLLDLPDDILLQVLEYLPLEDLLCQVRLLCQRCLSLSYDFSLWRKLDLRSKADFLTDDYFLRILREVCQHVESIDITGCQLLTYVSMVHGDIHCPRLKKVNVSKTKITNYGLEKLAEKYPNLQSLHCLHCKNLTKVYNAMSKLSSLKIFVHPYDDCYGYSEDTINMVIPLLKNNAKLETVRLCDNHIGDDVLITLGQQCKAIKCLEIHSCSLISGQALSSCMGNWPSLSSLDISGTSISDVYLKEVVDACPKLKELNVSECRRITDIGIIHLASHRGGTMEVLRLNDSSSYSGNVTDVALQEIGQRCGLLLEVYISFCPSVSDAGVQALLKGCSKLMVLDISGCLSLTDSALSGLTVACPDLRRVNASGCVQLTSRSINNIIQYGKKLRSVELMTCHYLCKLRFQFVEEPNTSPQSARDAVSSVNLPSLENKDTDIDAGLTQITKSPENVSKMYSVLCSQLHTVDFSFCSKIDNNSLVQLSIFCKHLQYLSVQGCYQLTDAAMEEVTKNCLRLAAFNISGGSVLETLKLTDGTLVSIAANCEELRTLSMTSNRLMTTHGFKKLLEGCRGLRSVYLTSGKGVVLQEVVRHAQKVRGRCSLKNFNLDYITAETKGNFMLKFPPLGRKDSRATLKM